MQYFQAMLNNELKIESYGKTEINGLCLSNILSWMEIHPLVVIP